MSLTDEDKEMWNSFQAFKKDAKDSKHDLQSASYEEWLLMRSLMQLSRILKKLAT